MKSLYFSLNRIQQALGLVASAGLISVSVMAASMVGAHAQAQTNSSSGVHSPSPRNAGFWTRQELFALPTPQAGRITDEDIHRDYMAYEAMQAEINGLKANTALPAFATAKAQCWLDVSFQEYTRNDRSSFVEESYAEAKKIVQALTASGGVGANNANQPWSQTKFLNRTSPDNIRSTALTDLARRVQGLSSERMACSPRAAACAQVELAHAVNEWQQGGESHARPYLMATEAYLKETEACAVQPRTPVAPSVPPAQAAVPAAPLPVAPIAPTQACADISFRGVAYFDYFKSSAQDFAAGSAENLDKFITSLRGFQRICSVTVVGHADRDNRTQSNQSLSDQRAQTVKSALVARGLNPAIIVTQGKGSAEQVASCPAGSGGSNANIRKCLEPNRRVDVIVNGVR